VEDDKQLASLVISPYGTQVLNLNGTIQLTATGKSISGNTIPDLTFRWKSNSTSLFEVSQTGLVTAKGNGTASISVSASGIESAHLMVQVNKISTFSGKGSGGGVKLKIENNILKLETLADFTAATSPPDLRMYLSNNKENVNGGVEIAALNKQYGARFWNVPSGISINQYKYAVIWCKQYGVFYGSADLEN
jgi:hypothetical protein